MKYLKYNIILLENISFTYLNQYDADYIFKIESVDNENVENSIEYVIDVGGIMNIYEILKGNLASYINTIYLPNCDEVKCDDVTLIDEYKRSINPNIMYYFYFLVIKTLDLEKENLNFS